MLVSMSPRAQYTQRAPKIIEIISFKGRRDRRAAHRVLERMGFLKHTKKRDP